MLMMSRKVRRRGMRRWLRIVLARWESRIVRSILGVLRRVGSREMRVVIVLVRRGLVFRSILLVVRDQDVELRGSEVGGAQPQ